MRMRIVVGTLLVVGIVAVVRWSNLLTDGNGDAAGPVEMAGADIDPARLIQLSLDAYGGADIARSLETLRLESAIRAYDADGNAEEGRATEYYRFPDRVRSNVSMESRDFVLLYDGLDAWTIREGQRRKGADNIAEGRRRGVKHVPILLIYSALNERSILGPVHADTLNNRRMYVLDITDAGGDQTQIWLDAESLLLARLDYTLYTSLGTIPVRVMMGEYQLFDGVQTATYVDFYYSEEIIQETRVDQASYNSPLSDTLFALPAG